jgi:hypothetical protein
MPPFQYRWEQLGNPFGPDRWATSIVLNGNDEPLLASVAGDLLNANGLVHRWTGNTWQQVGGNITTHIPNFEHQIAIEAGAKDPSVALSWYSGVSTNRTVGIEDRTGNNWQETVGPALIIHPRALSMLKRGTQRVVAITEGPPNVSAWKVQVHLWNGAQWNQLGQALPSGSYSGRNPSLAYDAQGKIVLAMERWKSPSAAPQVVAFRWAPNGWQKLGQPFKTPSSGPRLAVGAGGDMAIAFHGFSANTVRCAIWNGTQWKVTPAVSPQSGWGYSLDVDAGGSPVLAWENPSSSLQRIEVSWWNGFGWLTFSPAQGAGDSSAPQIKVASTDLPVVGWSEGDLSIFEGPDPTRRLKAARLVQAP